MEGKRKERRQLRTEWIDGIEEATNERLRGAVQDGGELHRVTKNRKSNQHATMNTYSISCCLVCNNRFHNHLPLLFEVDVMSKHFTC